VDYFPFLYLKAVIRPLSSRCAANLFSCVPVFFSFASKSSFLPKDVLKLTYGAPAQVFTPVRAIPLSRLFFLFPFPGEAESLSPRRLSRRTAIATNSFRESVFSPPFFSEVTPPPVFCRARSDLVLVPFRSSNINTAPGTLFPSDGSFGTHQPLPPVLV